MQVTRRTPHIHQLSSGIQEVLLSRDTIRSAHIRPSLPTPRTQLSQAGRCAAQQRDLTINQLDSGRDNRERVVVLGSGWAGYTVARQLDPRKYQAVVVSPRSYFAFTPLLASTSVGTLEFRTALEPVRSRRTKVNFFQGWADAVDFENKTVTIEEAVDDSSQGLARTTYRHAGETSAQRAEEKKEQAKKGRLFNLTYDKLVISVGCYSQTFNTPGVRENAYFLKDVGDARKIRNRMLACFEAAALPTTTDEMRKILLNFAVVGGGPTGIEFSAELHDIISEDLAKLYPELIKFHKVTVYDVAPKILPMFDDNLAKYAMNTFKREGIHIKTSHHVQELRKGFPQGVDAPPQHDVFTLKIKEEGDVGVGMVVWSTGLMQNPFVAQALNGVPHLPDSGMRVLKGGDQEASQVNWVVKKDAKTGSVITDDRLRLKVEAEGEGQNKIEAVLTEVFALGDCAILEGTAYPATAQVASQKADWLAKRLNKGDFDKAGFTWKNLGVMAYIGNWKALLQGGGGGAWNNISGRAAWIVWRGAYLTKSVSLRNKLLIPTYWLINWLFGRDINRF
ncbi:nucleotide-binding domain-containing protein [Lojkania enalia]|uniref:Nucleotide-binding domain-containing protein n=1 Tax=Lojkania enalia TaxID=147567 RepID=A0A9P4KH76_9PLEO|nr:nucleotide-binding domain-containing protein [Didymosphaeria enalia]